MNRFILEVYWVLNVVFFILILFFKRFIYWYNWLVLPICMSILCAYSTFRDQKMVLDFMELRLEMVVSHYGS